MEKISARIDQSNLVLDQIEKIIREKGLNEENDNAVFVRIKLLNLYLTRMTEITKND